MARLYLIRVGSQCSPKESVQRSVLERHIASTLTRQSVVLTARFRLLVIPVKNTSVSHNPLRPSLNTQGDFETVKLLVLTQCTSLISTICKLCLYQGGPVSRELHIALAPVKCGGVAVRLVVT